jgi:hypothetical protein
VHPSLWALTSTAAGQLCTCLPSCISDSAKLSETDACEGCDECITSYARAVSSSARQVHAYLRKYATVASLPRDTMKALEAAYSEAAGTAQDSLQHACAALAYHDAAAAAARTQWTQFRPGRIAAGLALLAVAWSIMPLAYIFVSQQRLRCHVCVARVSRAFFLRPPPPHTESHVLALSVIAAAALVGARAFIPFSNSLILGELQVTTFLMAAGVLVATGAALSRVLAVHRRVVVRSYAIPKLAAPQAALRWTWLLLEAALRPARAPRRPSGPAPPQGPPSHVEPAAAALAGKRLRTEPIVYMLACLGAALLLPWFHVRVGYAVCFGGAAFFVARTHWAFLDPARVASADSWQAAGVPRTARAALRLLAYCATALLSCYGLSRYGGVDRIGANPFDKATSASPVAAPVPEYTPPWLIAAPALLVCSVLAAQADAAARRVVALPATVRRFGVHVPWRKALGDAVLHLRSWGGVFAWLFDDRRMLMMLLELDALDDEDLDDEAETHHTPEVVREPGVLCVESMLHFTIWLCATHSANSLASAACFATATSTMAVISAGAAQQWCWFARS